MSNKYENLSDNAKECIKQWQKQIDNEGSASLLGESDVARELLKAGFVEESPFGGAFQVITCDDCTNIICKCKK